MKPRVLLLVIFVSLVGQASSIESISSQQLSTLKQDEEVSGFRVANLYSDPDGKIVGAKFVHARSSAPVFLLQIETLPKAFMWVDTPDHSDRGVPHALEHLILNKGTKGRYVTLLTNMRLSQDAGATLRDFNFYSFSSGTGMDGFLEQLHAWLDDLFRSDFTNTEAERELYHFGISSDASNRKTLIEAGSVYEEKQTNQGRETYYFELSKRQLGSQNPFTWDIRGIPAEMRHVSPEDIRKFYEEHYRLGPTTGFIFILDPKENVSRFLEKVSREFDQFSQSVAATANIDRAGEPKYTFQSSQDLSVGIIPFPSSRETNAGDVRMGWKPVKTESLAELKLLELFFKGLAGDQRSVLYKVLVDSKTREVDSGARKVDNDVFLQNSPYFPYEQVEVSGIPGNRITAELISQLSELVVKKIEEISKYPDQSQDLLMFNALVESYAAASRRSEAIWLRTPPLFGIDLSWQWKDHLNLLEMDRSFVKSLSQESAWQDVERQLSSQKNIWRELISKFHLQDIPYAMASRPSAKLFAEMETSRQERIRTKIQELRQQYHADDDQEALARFENDELLKTREIDQIEARVSRPRFTEHPPLTADDEIKYRQLRIAGVPVVASIFDRPPSLDIGLAFDLRKIPRKYYKYIPILARSFDSLGLKNGEQVLSYQELQAKIQEKTIKFSVAHEFNAASKRVDLVFRASGGNQKEFRTMLDLISQILHFKNLDLSSADRLRDLVVQRLAVDDAFKNDEYRWMQNIAYSFLTQEDQLLQAANSTFTRTHWDGRLKWLLHKPVSTAELDALTKFANDLQSHSAQISAREISQELGRSDLTTLQRELLEYWDRNLPLIPEMELMEGLRQLTSEVQQDLQIGPARTIQEIKELQSIVVNRNALHVDLVVDEKTLGELKPALSSFLKSLPAVPSIKDDKADGTGADSSIIGKVAKRYHLTSEDFPWYVGLVNPDATAGDLAFYADFPDYNHLDRASLIQVLASKTFAGKGPQSFYIKTREAGLSYAIELTTNPAFRLAWIYADRSPDLPGLVQLLNAVARNTSDLKDPLLVDYVLRQTFSLPRSIYPPSVRGAAIAQDLRDGNDPETVRRFSEAVLKLRQDPDLLSELTRIGVDSICSVLLNEKCKEQQKGAHSIFLFVGSEKILSDTEKRLQIPKLLRLWPSDYWLP